MNKRIIIVGLILALILAVAIPMSAVWSAEGIVTSTVTAQVVSIEVLDGEVTYGMVGLNQTRNTTINEENETQTATNKGNVTENFNIIGSDATGTGGGWSLSTNRGQDIFTHEFSIDGGTNWTKLNKTTYTPLATNVNSNTSITFDLQIGMPTIVSNPLEKTILVTVQAVAQ